MGHITRPAEFRRAIGCATMHDFFNILSVIILLPLESTTHFMEHTASFLAGLFDNVTHFSAPSSPIKIATGFIANHVKHLCENLPGHWPLIAMSAIGLAVLFVSLLMLTKVLNFPVHIATATAHYKLFICALFGLISYIHMGYVNFGIAVPMGAGAVCGARLGAVLSKRLSGMMTVNVTSHGSTPSGKRSAGCFGTVLLSALTLVSISVILPRRISISWHPARRGV